MTRRRALRGGSKVTGGADTLDTENNKGTPRGTAADAADAHSIHRRAVAVDMHADTVQFVVDEGADISGRVETTHLDAVRMREGGLDAQFFSVWVEPEYFGTGGERAVARADAQVEAVRALASRRPDVWALALSAADIRRAAAGGKLAALLGLEGGYAIDEKIERVGHYFERGVRYMTPTWTHSLSWAGSSGDEE